MLDYLAPLREFPISKMMMINDPHVRKIERGDFCVIASPPLFVSPTKPIGINVGIINFPIGY